MARSEDAAAGAVMPTEDQVATYLRVNADFLLRRPDVAIRLAPPARALGDGVADLQQHMIERLRHELDQMRGCAEHLISTTRSNMSTQARTLDAALSVLATRDMQELTEVLADLAELLEVDVVALCFETAEEILPALAVSGLQRLPAGHVAGIMGDAGRDVVLRPAAAGEAMLFGAGAGLVRSQALVRLAPGERRPPGLLALGARDDRAFHPGQGTELLLFLGRVVQYAAHRWVE